MENDEHAQLPKPDGSNETEAARRGVLVAGTPRGPLGRRQVVLPEPIHQDADSCVLGAPPGDGEAVEHLVKPEPTR